MSDPRSLHRPSCCPCEHWDEASAAPPAGIGLEALSPTALADVEVSPGTEVGPALPRRTLVVKPVFTYPLPQRHPQTSWRNWGGVQSPDDVEREAAAIQREIDKLAADADFPVKFLPLSKIRGAAELKAVPDFAQADAVVAWVAGDGAGDLMGEVNLLDKLGKDVVFFVRHESGPLYYWYEGVSARYLRQHTDQQAAAAVRCDDVVVDRIDEVLWRLRALAGLRATVGSRIVAIGRPGSWGWPVQKTLEQVQRLWKLDIQTVSYDDLGKLIESARANPAAVSLAARRTDEYLHRPETTLETDRAYVENAFLLEQVFRGLMRRAGCRAITIAGCMRTVMPISRTTACLALSTLNDDGYLAFCESDFVVVPSGILMGSITGRPTFLNDPTYPHDGLITLAHCTAPRKMDGKTAEPVRVLTHFESDYGAAPKVEMRIGQRVTMVAPDFAAQRWLGLGGEIAAHDFLPICRSQIDVRFAAPSRLVAERMPGFHWMLVYGDCLKELGYALRRVPIGWECLG